MSEGELYQIDLSFLNGNPVRMAQAPNVNKMISNAINMQAALAIRQGVGQQRGSNLFQTMAMGFALGKMRSVKHIRIKARRFTGVADQTINYRTESARSRFAAMLKGGAFEIGPIAALRRAPTSILPKYSRLKDVHALNRRSKQIESSYTTGQDLSKAGDVFTSTIPPSLSVGTKLPPMSGGRITSGGNLSSQNFAGSSIRRVSELPTLPQTLTQYSEPTINVKLPPMKSIDITQFRSAQEVSKHAGMETFVGKMTGAEAIQNPLQRQEFVSSEEIQQQLHFKIKGEQGDL